MSRLVLVNPAARRLLAAACVVSSLVVAARQAAAQPAPREPSLAEVLRLAERRSAASPAAPRAAAARARWASLLPRLELGVRRGLGQDLSLAQALGASDRTVVALDDSLSIEVRASLPLSGLVYREREEALFREEARRVARRTEVALAVARAWARRRRALRAIARGGPDTARDELELATAELDAWTGGAFGALVLRRWRAAATAASSASRR